MSPFREALRVLIESGLVCPHCKAMNRPGATYIELEPEGRAECRVCNRVGALAEFHRIKER